MKHESSKNVDRKSHLIGFVALMHHPQTRKYTGEPYHLHVQSVGKMADNKCDFGYEIGLCHDLLEDTECTVEYLHERLTRFGYKEDEATFICDKTVELTDVYIHENYPKLNRATRKQLEAERLHKVSYEAQTVKYCDLIDNTKSIVKHDKGFAKVYLQEKERILLGMTAGNPKMYKLALKSLQNAQLEIR